MKEDKRLSEVIRVQRRSNYYAVLDKGFIDDPRLSMKAKGIMTYLLSKPTNWKVIVIDLVNHCSDGKTAIYSGLNELREYGYYDKRPVRDERGVFIRWESTIYESPLDRALENRPSHPLADFPEMEKPKRGKPNLGNRERNNNDFSNNDFNNTEGRGSAPPPAYRVYGKYGRVLLTDVECNGLIAEYGESTARKYIGQLDRALYRGALTKPPGNDRHCATLEQWIERDMDKITESLPPVTQGRNRFNNFKQRKNDYARLEQLERQYLTESLKGGAQYERLQQTH